MKRVSVVLAIVLVCAMLANSSAMSAGDWFDACMLLQVTDKSERKKLSPEQRIAIRNCERIAAQVWCQEGFDGTKVKPEGLKPWKRWQAAEAVSDACPKALDMPLGGIHYVAIKYWERRGGPSWLQRWFSARSIILQAYQSRWPKCQAVRREYEAQTKPDEVERCVSAWLQVARTD
jgi:hypothetical protein